jgi:hypothetical protein
MKTSKITKKPDGRGMSPGGDMVNRDHLIEITEGGKVIDSAYFPTKAEAQEWAKTLYGIEE